MPSHTPRSLTLTDRLHLFLIIPLVLLQALLYFVTRVPWTAPQGLLRLKRLALISLGRNFISVPLPIMQAISPTTSASIARYTFKAKLATTAVTLPVGFTPTMPSHPQTPIPDATLHLISTTTAPSHPTAPTAPEPSSRRILLYLHGGGFVSPLPPSHLPWSLHLARTARIPTLAILEYAIAPTLRYPGQLAQAAAALEYLLQGRRPADILLAGDSAGGNLALGLLAHLHQPCPGIAPVDVPTPLGAILAVSPRCSNAVTASYARNGARDIVGKESLRVFVGAMHGDAGDGERQVWAEPVVGGAAFWRAALPVARLRVVMGGDEVYVDDARRVAAMLGAAGAVGKGWSDDEEAAAAVPGREYVEAPGECHVQAGLDYALGADGRMLRACVEFMESV